MEEDWREKGTGLKGGEDEMKEWEAKGKVVKNKEGKGRGGRRREGRE